MATMTADRLVEDYVRRLEDAAEHLPEDRRTELVLEIREHIDHALSETGTHDEIAVRNALERLGTPEEIVAAAELPMPREERQKIARLDIAALIALVIPFLGWIVGAVLVVLSRAWTGREKSLGLVLGLLPFVVSLLLVTVSGSSGNGQPVPVGTPEQPPTSNEGPLEFFALLLGFLAGLPSALYLGWRLSLRRQRD